MRVTKCFLLLSLFITAEAVVGETGKLPVKRGFPAYSSSYQPRVAGDVLRIRWLYPGESGPKLNLLERFDKARKWLYAHDRFAEWIPLSGFLSYYAYNPADPSWVGRCNNLAAAGSDRNLMADLRFVSPKGVQCGPWKLTIQDIKELITAIYPTNPEDAEYVGSRRVPHPEQSPLINLIERHVAHDLAAYELTPHAFITQVDSRLGLGDGAVVMDADNSDHVWNFTIVAMDDDRKPLERLSKYRVPTRFLEETEENRDRLKFLADAESFSQHFLDWSPKYASIDPSLFLAKLGSDVSPELKAMIETHRKTIDLISTLEARRTAIYAELRAEGLQVDPSVKVYTGRMRVDYASTVAFRDSSNGVEPEIATSYFRYMLIEKDDEVVYSRWLDSNFPEFIWWPKRGTDGTLLSFDRYLFMQDSHAEGLSEDYEFERFLRKREKPARYFALAELLNVMRLCPAADSRS